MRPQIGQKKKKLTGSGISTDVIDEQIHSKVLALSASTTETGYGLNL